MSVRTTVDRMIEALEEKRKVPISYLAKEFDVPEDLIEKFMLVLEKKGVVSMHYSFLPFQKPYVSLEKLLPPAEDKKIPGKILETYQIGAFAGHVSAKVTVYSEQGARTPTYHLTPPSFSPYSLIYLEYVKDEVTKILPPESVQMKDVERQEEASLRRCAITERLLADFREDELKSLCGQISYKMFGLGEIEDLLSDDRVEEVVVNNASLPVSLYHRKYGWMKTNVRLRGEDETLNYSSQIARRVGRQITPLTPLLDAHLISGDRVNATMYPISRKGNTVTIRRFSRDPWTIIKLIKNRTISAEVASMLWQAIHYEMNILVVGGTASGKTSMLNTLSNFIPPSQRIITIEDTRELVLSKYHWNWVPLVSRLPNPEGLGQVSMLDLMVNSLRMRPDRILVGEIRERDQASTLFEAMHTGHSVYSTMHADTGSEALRRLVQPPIEVPAIELEAVDLIVSQYRDRKQNIRKTYEVSEIGDLSEKQATINHIYLWKARTDEFSLVREPKRYTESLNLHTGMTEKEIRADREEKKRVLDWMDKHDLEKVDEIAKVLREYYRRAPELVGSIDKGETPSKVLE